IHLGSASPTFTPSCNENNLLFLVCSLAVHLQVEVKTDPAPNAQHLYSILLGSTSRHLESEGVRNMRRNAVLSFLGCILTFTASLCAAQTASINGTVSDSTGAVVD